MSKPATVRRSYVDCRFGQLHLRSAKPDTGDAAKFPPLICFHQSPQSGRIFTEVLKNLGRDRFVYAPDTPGFGESDPPNEMPEIADYAAAMGDLLDQLGHVPVDLLGYHTGALTATELALTRPHQIRRIVMIGVPLVDQAFIDAFNKQPWPVPYTEDETFVVSEWKRSRHWAGPGMTLPMIVRSFIEKLKPGEKTFWGARAAMRYGFDTKLPNVTQPILAIGPKDDLWDISPRCAGLLKNGRFERWPDHGFGIFDVAPDRINGRIREHLDTV